ncbi:MAG: SAM-dependent methyltransferase, partial [Candidatus Eremiobacteraeota bacterium]|nr:SAM-dependent methyltransferase [Candidatus Eremiobacteraeota bacterium]
MRGSLSVVGTGIKIAAQTSPEALAQIERADKVFYLEADALTRPWIEEVNPSAESLHALYGVGKDRRDTYEEMIERVLKCVRGGLAVCLVSYGHPGVFAYPMHESVRRARLEGFDAQMLPSISSEDCLFADLGVDPANDGCQTFEATDFLLSRRRFDTSSALVLLQIGVIAERGFKLERGAWNSKGVHVLRDVLLEHYPSDFKVTVYEAACYACCDPLIQEVALSNLTGAAISPISTLYIP